jgi:hypothetical protein
LEESLSYVFYSQIESAIQSKDSLDACLEWMDASLKPVLGLVGLPGEAIQEWSKRLEYHIHRSLCLQMYLILDALKVNI